jgi:hypothetical protein
LLPEASLSENTRLVYEAWVALIETLNRSIEQLAKYKIDLPTFTAYSKVIPDELVRIAYSKPNISIATFAV